MADHPTTHSRQRLLPFVLDLAAHEGTRVAAVLAATPDWEPATMLAAEAEAHRMLYSGLSPEQQAVYDMLLDQGVLDAA